MVDATAVAVKGTGPAVGLNIIDIEFTKANETDVVNVPAGYGTTVVWCDVNKKSTGVKDPATAISSLAVTLSVGTGTMRGLFMVV